MQAGKSDFVLFSLWSQSINKKWISSTRVYLLNSVETKSNGLPSCLSVVSSSSEKRLALSTVEDWMPLSRFRGQHSLHSLERNVLVSIVYSTGLIAANRGIVTSCTMILLRSSSFLYKTGEQSFALHCWSKTKIMVGTQQMTLINAMVIRRIPREDLNWLVLESVMKSPRLQYGRTTIMA